MNPNGSFTLHETGDREMMLFYITLSTVHTTQGQEQGPIVTAHNDWGKVIFSEACVKNSVHGGGEGSGVSAPLHAGIHPPRTRPQRADTPWGTDTPLQCMLGDTVNKRVVCILLECILVFYCAHSISWPCPCPCSVYEPQVHSSTHKSTHPLYLSGKKTFLDI